MMGEARDLADRSWKPSGEILTIKVPPHTWRMYDPGGRIARRLRTGKPYEHALLDRIKSERKPGTVALDIGAHVGNHTLYFALACGFTVHAFEALPYNVQRLRGNLDLNLAAAERVTVWPYAVGASRTRADWKPGRYLSLEENERGMVEVRTVDECLPGLINVSIVKMDIEGFEPQALAGMRELLTRNSPTLWTETHTSESIRAQAAVLAPLGYSHRGYLKMGSRMSRWER